MPLTPSVGWTVRRLALLATALALASCSSPSSHEAQDSVAETTQDIVDDRHAGDTLSSDESSDLAADTAEVVEPPPLQSLTGYVDPFIGTRGPGNVIPGPGLPHGMVKLSPDTLESRGSIDAYEWSTPFIEGFSHTHLEGPGGSGNGYSEILLVPIAGELRTAREQYASRYSHDNESASPGYYQVFLENPQVNVELTATHRAGFHRYTLPAGFQGYLLVDIGHTRGQSEGGEASVVDNHTLEGFGDYNMHPLLLAATPFIGGRQGDRRVYFSMWFSRPLDDTLMWNEGASPEPATTLSGKGLGVAIPLLSQDLPQQANLEVHVGISYISVQQARLNRQQEIADHTFEEIRGKARDAWNVVLNRIHVDGGTDDDKVRLYTALYHSLTQPVDFTEDGHFWIGFSGEGKVKEADGFRYHSDDWCIWDTFRTTHPLQLLIDPDRVADKMQSYVEMYKDGGWIPKCPWHATGYSRVMIGNHSICVLADAVAKGFRGFDTDTALEGAVKLAEEDEYSEVTMGVLGMFNYGTLPSYRTKGYVPLEEDETQAVSMTLEYAYGDWCLAQLADGLGKPSLASGYRQRSRSYIHHWDDETQFMRPKLANGQWLTPFDPDAGTGFCEADAWIYLWFVPHDPYGLIDLFGGNEPFLSKLDRFFEDGHFDPTNEPDFHAPFFYNYAGEPWKAQKWADQAMASTFSTQPDGLPGNDDAGATSAWFVFYAMGLYPFAPGETRYTITTPLFDELTLYLGEHHSGRRLVVRANGVSQGKRYIQSATWNGQPLNTPWIDHFQLVQGGLLEFVVDDQPGDWGK
jgi:predicted alpha-1,2-mannosidase